MTDDMGDVSPQRPHVTIPFDPTRVRTGPPRGRGTSTPRQRRTAIGCSALVLAVFILWPLIRWGARRVGRLAVVRRPRSTPAVVDERAQPHRCGRGIRARRLRHRCGEPQDRPTDGSKGRASPSPQRADPTVGTGPRATPASASARGSTGRSGSWRSSLAFINGAAMSAQWRTFRLALAAVPFPYTDPQFGRNVGFFVFQLPAYDAVARLAHRAC